MYLCRKNYLRDNADDYQGAAALLDTGKPVIIAHPYLFDTDLSRVPLETYIEINNRYIWRCNWQEYFSRIDLSSYNFVISSDAHKPSWLGQNVARYVAARLGIKETILF